MTPQNITLIPITELDSDDPTRLYRDEPHVNALTADFKQRLQDHPGEHPVQNALRVVRRANRYLIVAGNYRYLAALRVPLADVPCIVLPHDLDAAGLLIEAGKDNEMHLAYTPVEKARNIRRVMELRGCSQAKAAGLLGIKPPQAAKLMCVLRHYPEDLHALIGEGEGKVPFTVAYKLTQLYPDVAKIRELTDKVVRGFLVREDADDTVDGLLGKGGEKKPKAVTARTGRGVQAVFPPLDHEAALAELALVSEAIRRAQRNGCPLSSVQQFLRA